MMPEVDYHQAKARQIAIATDKPEDLKVLAAAIVVAFDAVKAIALSLERLSQPRH